MNIELNDEPLERYCVVDTADADVFGQAFITTFDGRHFEAGDGFRIRANFAQLEDLSLGYVAGNGPLAVEFPEMCCARLQIALSGHFLSRTGSDTIQIDRQQACIVSPERALRTEHDVPFQLLLLRVRTEALERKLTALLGARPKAPIEFDAASNNSMPQAVNLRHLLMFFACQLDAPVQPPPLVLAELQQTIALMFLTANPNTYSRQIAAEERDIAPRYVRQIEEYIEANWMRPINIEKLAALTGISARGIFKGFQRTRGYSPMAFAKRVRLERARAMLIDGESATTTVTSAAFACGFANLGHFAKYYREMFGERPSDTLQRARG
ncbi:AraC family transcriptional regulator [Rhodopseudomonas sp. B29]|uniref:AraC family transcriptional regulator n=1 Tax=Rhodopseudomonas sp. B29 TaxID=95607 RepID=UPI00034B9F2A|nr:AraC family transcriptional regulator [Rhodopseudomonas sp. B29]